MSTQPPTNLSEIVNESTGRRAYLTRASTLGLALPGVGILAGCSTSDPEQTGAAARSSADTGTAVPLSRAVSPTLV